MKPSLSGKRIFVTGATGFVGSYLLPKICLSNKVKALVRKPAPEIEKLGAETIRGGLLNSNIIENTVRDADLVIHLAATVRSNDKNLNYSVNVTGTKNIVQACEKHKTKLIYISTVNAVAKLKSVYGATKALAEKIVIESGTDYVILRCTLIYGKGSIDMEKILNTTKLPVVPMIGNGKNKLQPVYVEDVVDMILKSVKKSRKIYNIAGPDILTVEQLKNIILEKTRKKKLTIHIPLQLALLGALIVEKVSKNPIITKEQVLGFNQDRVLDITLSKKELGFNPLSFERGIEKYLNCIESDV